MLPAMANPAWKTAAEIADGYATLNAVALKKYQSHEIEALIKELEKILREIRSTVIAVDNVEETQKKNRKLLRLSQSMSVIQAYKLKNR